MPGVEAAPPRSLRKTGSITVTQFHDLLAALGRDYERMYTYFEELESRARRLDTSSEPVPCSTKVTTIDSIVESQDTGAKEPESRRRRSKAATDDSFDATTHESLDNPSKYAALDSVTESQDLMPQVHRSDMTCETFHSVTKESVIDSVADSQELGPQVALSGSDTEVRPSLTAFASAGGEQEPTSQLWLSSTEYNESPLSPTRVWPSGSLGPQDFETRALLDPAANEETSLIKDLSGSNGSLQMRTTEIKRPPPLPAAALQHRPQSDSSASFASVLPGTVGGSTETAPSPSTSEVVHHVNSKHRRRTENIARRTSHGGAVGQFVNPDEMRTGSANNMRSVVTGFGFDMSLGLVILANTLVMGLDAQYKGVQLGHDVGIYSFTAEEAMPGVRQVLGVAETVFGLIFTVELLVKVVVLKGSFCRSSWNVVDVVIVSCWIFEWLVGAAFLVNPMILRMMRVAKLVRIVRMVKTIQAFDALQVLVGSIMASFSALIWSSMFLLLILVMEALLMCNVMQDAARHISDEEVRIQLFTYFGTFSRSMITMFEVTLGNWVPCTRTLMEGISEWYGAFLVAHVLFVSFAVVMVIRGVFLQQTFAVASSDEELMVVQKTRASRKQQAQMKRLFEEFEVQDEEGNVSRERFRRALRNPKIRAWLSALELEVGDADLLFDCLDNGDECISLEKLSRGVPRLAGKSRSIDLVVLLHRTQLLEHRIGDLSKTMKRLIRDFPEEPSKNNSFCSSIAAAKKRMCGPCCAGSASRSTEAPAGANSGKSKTEAALVLD